MTGRLTVTGASGYLGSRLLAAAPAGGKGIVRKRIGFLPFAEQVEIDLTTEGPDLEAAFADADCVVHLAGHNEVVASQEPDRAMAETLTAARHVAHAAAAVGVPRLVYVSTVHVYGTAMVAGAQLDERTTPDPTSPYAIARLASEHLMTEAAGAGVEVVVLRLTNAVGAPAAAAVNRWTLVATDLCRQAVQTGELVLRSSGQQWRDFIALGDVCDAVLHCAAPGRIAPGIYNLGSGTSHTILDLAHLVQDQFEAQAGQRPTLTTAPAEANAPGPYSVSVDRLSEAGWRATAPLADAVEELVAFCLDHEGELT